MADLEQKVFAVNKEKCEYEQNLEAHEVGVRVHVSKVLPPPKLFSAGHL